MCWRWNWQQNWSQRAGCQASRWKQPGQTDKHGQRSVRWQGTGCRSYLQLLWLRGQEDTLGSGGDTKVCSRRRSKKEVGEPVRAVLQKAWAGVRTAGLLPAYRQRTATERDTVLHHEAAAAGGDNDKHKEYKGSESLHRKEVRVGWVDISLNLTEKFWCLYFESVTIVLLLSQISLQHTHVFVWHNAHFFTFWEL